MPQSPPMSFSNFSFPPPSRQATERSSDSLSGNVAQPPGSLGFSRDGVDSTFATRLRLETSPPIPSRPEGDYDSEIADSWIGPYRSDGSPSPSSPIVVHDLRGPLARRRTSPPSVSRTSPPKLSRAGSVVSSADVSPTMSRKSSSAFLRAIGAAVGNAIGKKLVRRKIAPSAEGASYESGSSPERPSHSVSIHSEVPTGPGHDHHYWRDPPPSPSTPQPRESIVVPLSPSLGGKHSHHWPATASTPTRSFAPQSRIGDGLGQNKRPESAESKVLGKFWDTQGWVGDGSGSEGEEYKADSVDGDSPGHLSLSSVRPGRPMSGSSARTAIYRGTSQKSRTKNRQSTENPDKHPEDGEEPGYRDYFEFAEPRFPSPPVHIPNLRSSRKGTRLPKKDASLQGGNPADSRSRTFQ
jgi:hypothetical protein